MLVPSLHGAEVHRAIYYIEKVCRVMKRGRINNSKLDEALRYVDAFDRYEETLMGGNDKVRVNAKGVSAAEVRLPIS